MSNWESFYFCIWFERSVFIGTCRFLFGLILIEFDLDKGTLKVGRADLVTSYGVIKKYGVTAEQRDLNLFFISTLITITIGFKDNI